MDSWMTSSLSNRVSLYLASSSWKEQFFLQLYRCWRGLDEDHYFLRKAYILLFEGQTPFEQPNTVAFLLWLGKEEDTLLGSCRRGAAWKWKVKVLGKRHHQFRGLLGSSAALSSSTLSQMPQGPREGWEKLLVHLPLRRSRTVSEGRRQRLSSLARRLWGRICVGPLSATKRDLHSQHLCFLGPSDCHVSRWVWQWLSAEFAGLVGISCEPYRQFVPWMAISNFISTVSELHWPGEQVIDSTGVAPHLGLGRRVIQQDGHGEQLCVSLGPCPPRTAVTPNMFHSKVTHKQPWALLWVKLKAISKFFHALKTKWIFQSLSN